MQLSRTEASRRETQECPYSAGPEYRLLPYGPPHMIWSATPLSPRGPPPNGYVCRWAAASDAPCCRGCHWLRAGSAPPLRHRTNVNREPHILPQFSAATGRMSSDGWSQSSPSPLRDPLRGLSSSGEEGERESRDGRASPRGSGLNQGIH